MEDFPGAWGTGDRLRVPPSPIRDGTLASKPQQTEMQPTGNTFAIVNQKGGVGKTTTAVNLSAALALLGHRILLLDLDPQGNSTSGVGVSKSAGPGSMYDVLIGGGPPFPLGLPPPGPPAAPAPPPPRPPG